MQRKELLRLTDYDLVLRLNEKLDNLIGDEMEFFQDVEEQVLYRQRLSPRQRNKMASIILRGTPDDSQDG